MDEKFGCSNLLWHVELVPRPYVLIANYEDTAFCAVVTKSVKKGAMAPAQFVTVPSADLCTSEREAVLEAIVRNYRNGLKVVEEIPNADNKTLTDAMELVNRMKDVFEKYGDVNAVYNDVLEFSRAVQGIGSECQRFVSVHGGKQDAFKGLKDAMEKYGITVEEATEAIAQRDGEKAQEHDSDEEDDEDLDDLSDDVAKGASNLMKGITASMNKIDGDPEPPF